MRSKTKETVIKEDIPDISRLTKMGKVALYLPYVIAISILGVTYIKYQGVNVNLFSGILWDALLYSISGLMVAYIVNNRLKKEQKLGGHIDE